jgi:hypothetical protein
MGETGMRRLKLPWLIVGIFALAGAVLVIAFLLEYRPVPRMKVSSDVAKYYGIKTHSRIPIVGNRDGPTPTEVEQMLEQNISVGDSKEKVHAWLRTTLWSFGEWFRKGPGGGPPFGPPTPYDLAGLKEGQIPSYTYVELENGAVSCWLPGRIYIYFFFDNDDKLIKYYVYQWSGPSF